jgi:hypothetical protein
MPADWLIDRVKVGRSTDLPPCHLLREVFETCRDYAEARNLLTTSPICLPALFILAGAKAGEGCIIERTEDAAAIVDAPPRSPTTGSPPPSAAARRAATTVRPASACSPPAKPGPATTSNGCSRRSPTPTPASPPCSSPAAGRLTLQGWERTGPATRILHLQAPN